VNSCLHTVTGEKAPIHGKSDLQVGIGTLVIPHQMWVADITAPIHGKSDLQVGIGTLVIPHQMWVADITDECILGLDFLERHGCQVDLKQGILLIAEEEVPLQQPRKDTEPNSHEKTQSPPAAESLHRTRCTFLPILRQ